MFEKYTDKARKVIFFARYEASQYGSSHIEVPHLLLGLIRENFQTIRRVANIDPGTLHRALEPLCPTSQDRQSIHVDLPLSHSCKRALTFAAEEAERLAHAHIGTEHLLLGVLREDGPEARALRSLGIELEAAREEFRRPVGDPPGHPASRTGLLSLLSEVPDDRLAVAAKLLAGLTAEYFAVAGVSPDGPFSFSFGVLPH